MNVKYTGIYPNGNLGRFKLQLSIPGVGQQYIGTFAPIEEALEANNNLVYYLNNCGRGILMPLLGPDELQSKYRPPAYVKPEDVHEYIPAPTELTQEWVKKVCAILPLAQGAVFQGLDSLPSVLLQNLRKLSQELEASRLQAIRQLEEQFASQAARVGDILRNLDPEVAEAEKQLRQDKEWVATLRPDDKERRKTAHNLSEEIYAKFPFLRPEVAQ